MASAAAIAGLEETGTVTDAERLSSFLQAAFPRVRRAALFALSKLDPERALPAALRALGDGASSVRRAGVAVLIARAHQVDFSEVSRLWETLTPASARRSVLRLLREAPKWDAAIFLLRALADPDQTVRTMASQWLDSWVADFNRSQTPPSEVQLQKIRSLLNEASSAMSTETADLLRFAVKTR